MFGRNSKCHSSHDLNVKLALLLMQAEVRVEMKKATGIGSINVIVQSSGNVKSSEKIFFIIRFAATEADVVVASESSNKTRTFTIEFDEHEIFIASPLK